MSEDAGPTALRVLANDSDPNPGDALKVFAVATAGTLGEVLLSPVGRVSYHPNDAFQGLKAGETATDQFQYTISDGHGGTATASAVLTVVGVNDAPLFTSPAEATVAENTTAVLELTATNPQNDAVAFTLGGGADVDLFAIAGNSLSFVAPPDFEAPTDEDENGIYQVEVTATDPTGNATSLALSVTVTNDPTDDPSPPELPPGEMASTALDFMF